MEGVLFYYVFLCILILFLCIALMQAVQKLIDEEFEGIVHLRMSTFQKRVATARHDFIKLTGAENKLEALLQVRKLLSLLFFAACTHSCLSIHSSLLSSWSAGQLSKKIQRRLLLYLYSPFLAVSCCQYSVQFHSFLEDLVSGTVLFHSAKSLNESLAPPPFYDKYSRNKAVFSSQIFLHSSCQIKFSNTCMEH